MSKFSKSNPIPTRFEEPEDAFLKIASQSTGIPVSELIRRSVRLLKQQSKDARDVQLLVSLSA